MSLPTTRGRGWILFSAAISLLALAPTVPAQTLSRHQSTAGQNQPLAGTRGELSSDWVGEQNSITGYALNAPSVAVRFSDIGSSRTSEPTDAAVEPNGDFPARFSGRAIVVNFQEDNRAPDLSADQDDRYLEFAKVDLRSGINNNSFQHAVGKPEYAEPFIAVINSSVPAPQVYRYGQAGFWKTWDSPNICYRPLYFEEPNLERYGYHFERIQPAVSGLHFLSNVLALPYKRGVHGPRECVSGLGYYRPGNCNPAYWPRLEKGKLGFTRETLTIGALLVMM